MNEAHLKPSHGPRNIGIRDPGVGHVPIPGHSSQPALRDADHVLSGHHHHLEYHHQFVRQHSWRPTNAQEFDVKCVLTAKLYSLLIVFYKECFNIFYDEQN